MWEPVRLQALMNETDVVPAVNQIELHPYNTRPDLRAANEASGIITQAWSPIGGIRHYRGDTTTPLNDSTIQAIADRYGKTTARVMIRWHVQQGRSAIPRSVHRDRIAENSNVFDFDLAIDELARIDALHISTPAVGSGAVVFLHREGGASNADVVDQHIRAVEFFPGGPRTRRRKRRDWPGVVLSGGDCHSAASVVGLRRGTVMAREVVRSAKAPSSPFFSQGVKAGPFVFISGTVGTDPSNGQLAGDSIQEQTRQALANCQAILEAAGTGLADVVEVGLLLSAPSDFAGLNEEYARWFPQDPPARYVAKLGVDLPGILVSIRMTAFIS